MTPAQEKLYAALLGLGHPDAAEKIKNRVASEIENENFFSPNTYVEDAPHRILLCAFSWENTIEGHAYWHTVFKELHNVTNR